MVCVLRARQIDNGSHLPFGVRRSSENERNAQGRDGRMGNMLRQQEQTQGQKMRRLDQRQESVVHATDAQQMSRLQLYAEALEAVPHANHCGYMCSERAALWKSPCHVEAHSP